MVFEIFAILSVVYLIVITYLNKNSEKLPEWISIWGNVFILLHLNSDLVFIDKILEKSTQWRRVGNLAVGLAITGSLFAFAVIVFSGITILTTDAEAAITSPQNYLVVPGLNDFLPLSVAPEIVIGLLSAMIIHEFGHALYSKYEGIRVESTGALFLSVIPFGAFVEPDETDLEESSRMSRLRMTSAGIFNNLVIAIISGFLLLILINSFITPIAGASIGQTYENSAAEQAGLTTGDTITTINNAPISSNEELTEYLRQSNEQTVTVETQSGETVEVEREVQLIGVLETSSLTAGEIIQQVNGNTVKTHDEFISSVESAEENTVTVQLQNGETHTHETGAVFTAQSEVQIGETTIDRDETIRIISSNGDIVHSHNSELTSDTTVTAIVDNQEITGDLNQSFFENTTAVDGFGGVEVSDFGVIQYPVEEYYSVLSGETAATDGLLTWILLLIVLPLGTVVGFTDSFPGFTQEISMFFTAPIEPVFFVSTVLFWILWINLNVAIFNCLPTFGLDGGSIFRDSFTESVSRLGGKTDSTLVKHLPTMVNTVTIGILLLIILSPFF